MDADNAVGCGISNQQRLGAVPALLAPGAENRLLPTRAGGGGVDEGAGVDGRLCEEIDERVKASLDRPLEGDWLYVWLDATCVKVRRNRRVVSLAVIVAVGVDTEHRKRVAEIDLRLRPVERRALACPFLHASR